jgi:hypothetical protein
MSNLIFLRFAIGLLIAVFFVGCAENISKTAAQPGLSLEATELSLNEFFKFPVAARGLEPTEKLLSLNNKQVRVSGYMVKEEEPTAGLFMLAPLPVSMAEKEDGPADDMPPATLFVHLPQTEQHTRVFYRKGIWQLTGILELGNQEEANGRMSYARLILSNPAFLE